MQTNSRTPFWHNPDLLKILTGETISDLGSQVGGLALQLLAAMTLAATPAQMAVLLSADYLPRVIVGLLAAGWIDRVRRRPLLITANVGRALVLATVAACASIGVLRADLLYAAALILAGLDVVFTSTFAAYLPALVSPASLAHANTVRATSSSAADVVGPTVAGVLISALGAPLAVAVDAFSFVASIGGLALVRTREPTPVPALHRHDLLAEVIAGWQALSRQPVLRAITATAFTANFFYRVSMSVYVLYLTRTLGLSPATVGAIFGLGGGLGVLIGSACASTVARRFGTGRTMITAHLLFGVLGLPLALSVVEPEWAVLLVFASEFTQLAVNAIYMVNRTTVEQTLSSVDVRGRIQACRTVAHAIAGVLGLLLGGVLGEQFGPGAAIVVGVLGGLTSFIWLYASPLRALHDPGTHKLAPK